MCGNIFCEDCAPTSVTLGVRICSSCGYELRKQLAGVDRRNINASASTDGPSFRSVMETATAGAGIGLLVGVAVLHAPITLTVLGAGTAAYAAQRKDNVGVTARRGGRLVHDGAEKITIVAREGAEKVRQAAQVVQHGVEKVVGPRCRYGAYVDTVDHGDDDAGLDGESDRRSAEPPFVYDSVGEESNADKGGLLDESLAVSEI